METGFSLYNTALNGDASPTPPAGHSGPVTTILQLPTELVVEVFQFALPSADFTRDEVEAQTFSYVRTLYTIRLIAKRWQEIVDGTPTLWKFVMPALPPHVNEATISRSGNGPLTIIYTAKTSDIGDDHPSAQDFVDSLAHTFPRWSAYRGPVVSGYFDKPAPHLQTIVLWQERLLIKGLELLGGSARNLRHVDISDISVRWTTGLFADLKLLRLRGVSDEKHKLTVTHLLDALRASPGLEHLNLNGLSVTIDHPPSLPVITLPHLRYIKFDYCTDGLAGAILRQIRAPSCTHVFIHMIPMNFGEAYLPLFLNEDFGPFEDLLRAIHSRNGSSKITLDSSFTWKSHAEEVEDLPSFYVLISQGVRIPCISWVERILQGNPGLSFSISSTINWVVLESIESMRCITRVEIEDFCAVDKCLLALKFIGEPQSTDPVLPSLPCLRELLLNGGEWTTQNVLGMVRSRFSSPLWGSTERTPLTISIFRGAFVWDGSPRPIPDLTTLVKIRETDGVECVRFVGPEELDGTLAIFWDESTSAPARGTPETEGYPGFL